MKIDKNRENKRLHLLLIPVIMVALLVYAITDDTRWFLICIIPLGIQAIIFLGKAIYVGIPNLIADKIIEKRVKALVTQWRARKRYGINKGDLPDNL